MVIINLATDLSDMSRHQQLLDLSTKFWCFDGDLNGGHLNSWNDYSWCNCRCFTETVKHNHHVLTLELRSETWIGLSVCTVSIWESKSGYFWNEGCLCLLALVWPQMQSIKISTLTQSSSSTSEHPCSQRQPHIVQYVSPIMHYTVLRQGGNLLAWSIRSRVLLWGHTLRLRDLSQTVMQSPGAFVRDMY